MHLRRALLLFAIVLGLAALVASLSHPERGQRAKPLARSPEREPARPARRPQGTVTVRFATGRRRAVRRLAVGRSAVVSVATQRPGEASIQGLGLSGAAEPDTPASFELFETEPGRYAVFFTAAGAHERTLVGTLVVAR